MRLTNSIKDDWALKVIQDTLKKDTTTKPKLAVFYTKLYANWYDANIKPYENQSIMALLPTVKSYSPTLLGTTGERLERISIFTGASKYHYSSFTRARGDNFIDTSGFNGIEGLFYCDAKNAGSYSFSPTVRLTPEQQREYEAINQEAANKIVKATKLASTIVHALQTTTTHSVLKKNFPGIYSMMPDSASEKINKEIQVKAEAKRNKSSVVSERIKADNSEVLDDYNEIELELRKAAFVSKATT